MTVSTPTKKLLLKKKKKKQNFGSNMFPLEIEY